MNDDRLRQLLRRLPRERASTGFTGRVLQRLDAAAPGRAAEKLLVRVALAASGVMAIGLVAAIVGWTVALRPEPTTTAKPDEGAATSPAVELVKESAGTAPRVESLESLRQQHRALSEELRELRQRSRSGSPLLYLGGTDQLDVVVDLGRLGRARKTAEPMAQPTARETPP